MGTKEMLKKNAMEAFISNCLFSIILEDMQRLLIPLQISIPVSMIKGEKTS